MLWEFLLVFCRVVTGGVFTISFLSKIGDVPAFQTTIANFHVLPKDLTKSVAVLFLLSEFIVTVCIVMGGKLLTLGFSLATFVLIVFTIAIVTVLARRMQTSCNCFGASSRAISHYDVVRNVGFLACAIGGWIVLSVPKTVSIALTWLELGLIGFVAVTFMMIWMHVAEIIETFRPL